MGTTLTATALYFLNVNILGLFTINFIKVWKLEKIHAIIMNAVSFHMKPAAYYNFVNI